MPISHGHKLYPDTKRNTFQTSALFQRKHGVGGRGSILIKDAKPISLLESHFEDACHHQQAASKVDLKHLTLALKELKQASLLGAKDSK